MCNIRPAILSGNRSCYLKLVPAADLVFKVVHVGKTWRRVIWNRKTCIYILIHFRCKLFYQKDGAWTERGVGHLHLKKIDEKTQLLVRADTNLGNTHSSIFKPQFCYAPTIFNGGRGKGYIVSPLSVHPSVPSRPSIPSVHPVPCVTQMVSVRYLLKKLVYWIEILYTCI